MTEELADAIFLQVRSSSTAIRQDEESRRVRIVLDSTGVALLRTYAMLLDCPTRAFQT